MSSFKSIFLFRHLRFLLRSSDSIISTPADPANLRNKDTAKECRMDAMESDQSETKKLALMNSAKIEELADGELNESWVYWDQCNILNVMSKKI